MVDRASAGTPVVLLSQDGRQLPGICEKLRRGAATDVALTAALRRQHAAGDYVGLRQTIRQLRTSGRRMAQLLDELSVAEM